MELFVIGPSSSVFLYQKCFFLKKPLCDNFVDKSMIQMYTIQNFTEQPVQDLEILRGAKE